MSAITDRWREVQAERNFNPNIEIFDLELKREAGESIRSFYCRQESTIKEFVENYLWFKKRGKKQKIKLIKKQLILIADLFFARKDAKTKQPIQAAIVWANRGGGKSLVDAIIIFLCMVWKSKSFSDLAGSQEQALEVYEYVREFWECIPVVKEKMLEGEPLITRTKLKNGVNLKCIANSQNQARGKHPEGFIADETCQKERYKDQNVLDATNSVLTQDEFLIIYSSTFHLAYGLFSDTWDGADILEFKRYRWNIFDCVLPDTQIVTKDGIKPIKDVRVGEYVLTSDGTFRKVLNVWKKKSKKRCFNVDIYGCASKNEFTADHRIKILRGDFRNKYNRYKKPGREWTYDEGKIVWKKVKDIRKDDFAILPLPKMIGKGEKYLRFETLKNGRSKYGDILDFEISADYDLGLFIGMILGDGCATDITRITVTINSQDKDWIKLYKDVVYRLFNIECKDRRASKNGRNIVFSLKGLGEWLFENCYKDGKKYIKFDRILKANKDFLLGYIKGLFITDGCLPSRPRKEKRLGSDMISFANTSKSLVDSLWMALLRIGVVSSKRKDSSGRKDKEKVWHLSVGGNNARKLMRLCGDKIDDPKGSYSRQYKRDNFLFSQIRGITEIDNPGEVYDIEVEGIHDFVAGSTIAHNCMERCEKKIDCRKCKLTRKRIKRDTEGKIVKIRYFGCNGKARKSNGYLTFTQVLRAKTKAEISGRNWRVEFECHRPETSGKVYKTKHVRKSLVSSIQVPVKTDRCVGLDWGTSKQASMVLVVKGSDSLLIPWSDFSTGKDLDYIVDTLRLIRARFGDFVVFADAENTYGIMYLRKNGFIVEKIAFNAHKMSGIQNLERYFNNRRLKILNIRPNRILWQQLIKYKKDEFGKPIKKEDHGPDALMCAGLRFDFMHYYGRYLKKDAAAAAMQEREEESSQVEVF